jgi:hypothetical protein
MKTKMVLLLLIFTAVYTFTNTSAQPNPGLVKEKMQKFAWMEGDWQGDAWYIGRDQKKTDLKQKEHILSRLDGTILSMEGTGYNEQTGSEESKIVFQAFGILTYDLSNSKYVIRAYQGGNFIDSDLVTNEDGSYSWGMDMPYGKTRYILRHTEEGKWIEKGEFSWDGGTTWVQTFEMTLTKLR